MLNCKWYLVRHIQRRRKKLTKKSHETHETHETHAKLTKLTQNSRKTHAKLTQYSRNTHAKLTRLFCVRKTHEFCVRFVRISRISRKIREYYFVLK
jgi:hypothetical protein